MKLLKYVVAFPAAVLLALGLFACGDDETIIETHTYRGLPEDSFWDKE